MAIDVFVGFRLQQGLAQIGFLFEHPRIRSFLAADLRGTVAQCAKPGKPWNWNPVWDSFCSNLIWSWETNQLKKLGNKLELEIGIYEISWDLDWEMIENQKLVLGLDLEILFKM